MKLHRNCIVAVERVMRLIVRRSTLLSFALAIAVSALAATPTEFYAGLLQRGILSFEAERFADATTQLKLAAFGLVDSIENYQKAQVYLTLTYDRLGDVEKARDAARRVVVAERIQPRYGTLAMSAGVASSFETVATRLIGASEVSVLKRSPQTTVQPPAVAQPPAQTTQAPKPSTPVVAPKPVESAPATTEKPKPVEKPAAKPAAPAPIVPKPSTSAPATPPPSSPSTTNSSTSAGSASPRGSSQPAPAAPQKPAASQISPQDVSAKFAAADRALSSAQLSEARRVYRALVDSPGLSREMLIRAAEGLYRARDFDGALTAFSKVGALRRGEEPYHYYLAVALYETGQYARAKAEMDAAAPFIEITPDVARYRSKIESAIN
jgi:outer membrane biosynthesis protein TonB